MTKQVSEADTAIALAEAFGRKPPMWATEARDRERRTGGEPTMTRDEALNVLIGEAFSTETDHTKIAEARTVLGEVASVDAGASREQQRRMAELIGEVAREAERALGMSPERAKLEAQSQAMLCRESTQSVGAAVTRLEEHLGAMRQAPGSTRRHLNEGGR